MASLDPLDPLLAALDADARPEAASQMVELVVRYLASARRGEGAVTSAHPPEVLAGRFDEPLPAAMTPLADVIARLASDVLPDVTRLAHPMYMGHQVSAPLPAAVWTESLISALNQSAAVSEMGPALTAIERQVVRWFADRAGLGKEAGGTLTSGGTEATFTALLAARAVALPDAWERGLAGPLPKVVCGEHAHYSVSRAVGMMGLGTDRVVTVPTRDFRMDVDALTDTLDRLAAEGTRVMAVVATAGTTATGSFDDLSRIGPVCRDRGLWLHVDGAHGASALFSPRHAALLQGVEHARSLTWDPHKMLSLPLAAGLLLVRDGRDLDAAFTQKAPYLFHGGTGGRSWDLGPRSFQCSRRGDALKLWVVLQRYGASALGALYARLCDTAQTLHTLLADQPDFEVLHRPEANIVCFRHLPAGMDPARLDAFQETVRSRYHRSGRGFITITTLGGRRVLRVTLMNPFTERTHLEALLQGLRAEGAGAAG